MFYIHIKQAFVHVPSGIRNFARKALLMLVAWFLLYYCLLQPYRVPDKWLTDVTASSTVSALNKLYKTGFTHVQNTTRQVSASGSTLSADIVSNNQVIVAIADACNAFELYVLFVCFLICLPTTFKRFLLFSMVGIASIFILNIARCFALTWLTINKPSLVDFAHHYAFTLIVYSFMFGTWVIYAKKYQLKQV